MAKRVLGVTGSLLGDVAKAEALGEDDLSVLDDRHGQSRHFPGLDRVVHERVEAGQRLLGGRDRIGLLGVGGVLLLRFAGKNDGRPAHLGQAGEQNQAARRRDRAIVKPRLMQVLLGDNGYGLLVVTVRTRPPGLLWSGCDGASPPTGVPASRPSVWSRVAAGAARRPASPARRAARCLAAVRLLRAAAARMDRQEPIIADPLAREPDQPVAHVGRQRGRAAYVEPQPHGRRRPC